MLQIAMVFVDTTGVFGIVIAFACNIIVSQFDKEILSWHDSSSYHSVASRGSVKHRFSSIL